MQWVEHAKELLDDRYKNESRRSFMYHIPSTVAAAVVPAKAILHQKVRQQWQFRQRKFRLGLKQMIIFYITSDEKSLSENLETETS